MRFGSKRAGKSTDVKMLRVDHAAFQKLSPERSSFDPLARPNAETIRFQPLAQNVHNVKE